MVGLISLLQHRLKQQSLQVRHLDFYVIHVRPLRPSMLALNLKENKQTASISFLCPAQTGPWQEAPRYQPGPAQGFSLDQVLGLSVSVLSVINAL